ncbi:MAG: DUF3108 domain-containing protein [Bacteroidota bacterium]|nr:DUF3108 domain-containing protein [Bacteroidota bacterium]
MNPLIKLYYIFLIPFLFNPSCFSQELKSAYKEGEWFEFRIYYGIFNASYASLELSRDTLRKVPVFHSKGYGKTTGLARFFFKVEDYYESYFTVKGNQPIRFIRNIYEGGYTKNLEILFDHEKKLAHVNNKKKNIKQTFSTKENVQDLISAFYYLRNFYPDEGIEKNESFSINMFFDNENYIFKLKYLGKQILQTKFGKIRCLKFRPIVQAGRVFKEQESVTLWVSDDKNKIPVRLQADLLIGSIKADLENYKNLKHPLILNFD